VASGAITRSPLLHTQAQPRPFGSSPAPGLPARLSAGPAVHGDQLANGARFLAHDLNHVFSAATGTHGSASPGWWRQAASNRSRLSEEKITAAAPAAAWELPSQRWAAGMGHAHRPPRSSCCCRARAPMAGPPAVAGSGFPGWPPPAAAPGPAAHGGARA